MCFCMQVLLLVDAFMIETGMELAEVDIALCWCLGVSEIPSQKDSPLTNIIAFLELVRHEPLTWALDELVYLPLLSQDNTPHRSHHLGHILGCIVDIGNSMPAFWFHMTSGWGICGNFEGAPF